MASAHIELVRDALDAAIREKRLRSKSAKNLWSVLTMAFKAACASKDKTLRVLASNPCIGVLPPDKGETRRKRWIYPIEFEALALKLRSRDLELV